MKISEQLQKDADILLGACKVSVHGVKSINIYMEWPDSIKTKKVTLKQVLYGTGYRVHKKGGFWYITEKGKEFTGVEHNHYSMKKEHRVKGVKTPWRDGIRADVKTAKENKEKGDY